MSSMCLLCCGAVELRAGPRAVLRYVVGVARAPVFCVPLPLLRGEGGGGICMLYPSYMYMCRHDT